MCSSTSSTALPRVPDLRKPGIYEATDRLRREGTANLVAAALDAGVERMVAQSIAFAYRPDGNAVKGEDAPLAIDAPAPFGQTVRAVASLEEQVTATRGLEGTVLRYGWLYGEGTYFARDGFIAGEVLRRRYPLIGSAKGIYSFVHTSDAAAATVAAIERTATGILNVVDDEPLALREWLPIYAEALGAKPPLRVPRIAARLAAGPVVAQMATEMRGASNAKAQGGSRVAAPAPQRPRRVRGVDGLSGRSARVGRGLSVGGTAALGLDVLAIGLRGAGRLIVRLRDSRGRLGQPGILALAVVLNF